MATRGGGGPRARAPFPGDEPRVPWPDGAASGGLLTWTGVAGFVFELAGTRIALDPFVSRPSLWGVLFRAPRPDTHLVEARFADLDAVFVGHAHYDHTLDLPAVAKASPGAVFHGGPVAMELGRRLGIACARLRTVQDGKTIEVGPFRVGAVPAAHGKLPLARLYDRETLMGDGPPRTPLRYPRGEVYGWRVEGGGRTFYVQGSAGLNEAGLEGQAPVDALVACLALRHGTPGYLPALARRLEPEILVPCHHDDLFRPLRDPPRGVYRLGWSRFLEEAREMEADHGTRLWCPPRDLPCSW